MASTWSPVAPYVEVAEDELVLKSEADPGAEARVIIRVTKCAPRRGLSWLSGMPQQAKGPRDLRELIITWCANAFATAWGGHGWKVASSVCGDSSGAPNMSERDAWCDPDPRHVAAGVGADDVEQP